MAESPFGIGVSSKGGGTHFSHRNWLFGVDILAWPGFVDHRSILESVEPVLSTEMGAEMWRGPQPSTSSCSLDQHDPALVARPSHQTGFGKGAACSYLSRGVLRIHGSNSCVPKSRFLNPMRPVLAPSPTRPVCRKICASSTKLRVEVQA